MAPDPFATFKAKQRESWALFAPLETITTPVSGQLVRFAGVRSGQRVLDVGTGTGVAAITAARAGATVTGLDLTPELLARAKENAAIAGCDDIVWKEGDAENLPYADASFDVVMSQFGHMFAPRAQQAADEMLRVLKPGGTLAFATWPPHLFTGRTFPYVAGYMPPPPPDAKPDPPQQWGAPEIITQRIGKRTKDVAFDAGTMRFPALSVPHVRDHFERTAGPVIQIVKGLASEPAKLAEFRRGFERLIGEYTADNVLRMDYLLTRAVKT